MKCVNKECEMRKYCEGAHALNNLKFDEESNVVIPNRFFFELNINNRLAKIGVPAEGFTFGCFEMVQDNKEFEGGSLFINNNHIHDFALIELIDLSNHAFKQMIANGEIRIG